MITPYNSWVKWEVKSMQGCSKTSESLQTTKLVGQTMMVNHSVEKLPTGSARDFQETQWASRVFGSCSIPGTRVRTPSCQPSWRCDGAVFFLWFTQMVVFIVMGVPISGWFMDGKSYEKMDDDWGVPPFGFLATYRNWASPSLGLLPVWWLRRGARRTAGHDNCWQLGWQLPFYSCLDPSFRVASEWFQNGFGTVSE